MPEDQPGYATNSYRPNSPDEASFSVDGGAEAAGQVIGHYKLLQHVGTGGFGVVWMAEQTEPVRRQVAVKILRRGLDSDRILARFEAERQALAVMDHPNIAKVLDAGTTAAGRPFFVMELIKGQPITEYCDQNRVPLAERLELFGQVCQAIQHAHQKAIIHRDIKPSNVLVAHLDGKPVPKVIDFGIAKALTQPLTDRTLYTGFGEVVGTFQYMSPEQASFSAIDVDTRSDVYSLGVLLYELLTGSTPLTKDRLDQVAGEALFKCIREDDVPRPSARLSESRDTLAAIGAKRQIDPLRLTRLVRGELDWIVMKCLEKNRADRYESPTALAADLHRYATDEPVLARPHSSLYRLSKFVRKHKTSFVAASFVLVSLLAGLTAATLGLIEARRARDAEAEQLRMAQDSEAAERQARVEAQQATEKERAAAEVAGKRLGQLQQANNLLRSIFKDIDPTRTQNAELLQQLKIRLQEIARDIDRYDLGESIDVAQFQALLGRTLDSLGDPKMAIDLLVRARVAFQKYSGENTQDFLLCSSQLAEAYEHAGRGNEALALFRKTLEQTKAVHPKDDEQTYRLMANFANALSSAGQYAEALELQKAAVDRLTTLLGADHPDTARSMFSLANTNYDLGDCARALALYESALERMKTKLGADHLDSLRCLAMIAATHAKNGDDRKSLTILEEIAPKVQRRMGAENRQTLFVFEHMAEAYRKVGRLSTAIQLLETNVERRRAILGEEHPDTLSGITQLAGAFEANDETSKAIRLYEDVVPKLNKCLGPDDQRSLVALAGMGSAYFDAGDQEKGISLCERAFERLKATLGANHPNTLTMMHNLSISYRRSGKLKKALSFAEDCHEALAAKLGTDHLKALESMSVLGNAYQDLGQTAKAIRLYETALAGLKEKVGDDHPESLNTMSNLADCYRSSGRATKALPLQKFVLEKFKERLGEDHTSTLTALNNLALSQFAAGNKDVAIAFLDEVLLKTRSRLGDVHPKTLQCKFNLGVIYLTDGDHVKATPLFEDCLAGRKSKLGETHFETLEALDHLALAYLAARDTKKAAKTIEILVSSSRQVDGAPSPVRFAGTLALNGFRMLNAELFVESEPLFRESLVIREKHLPDDWLTFNTRVLVGASLLGQKKYAEAEPLLIEGYKGMRERAEKIPAQTKVRLVEAEGRLAKLFEATRESEEREIKETLSDEAKEKSHEVKVVAGRPIVVEMTSERFDTYLRLEDGQGKTVAENDDVDAAKKNLNSRIVFVPAADGDYRIVATSFQNMGRGPYRVAIRQYAAKKKE